MIKFDGKTGQYELKGSGEEISKDYIGLTIAIGREMVRAGVSLDDAQDALKTLTAQGLLLIEEREPEKPNNLINFATQGGSEDV